MSSFSDLQLDALGELANIGSGTAAGALSSMLGRPVDVTVPNALALALADAVDAAGPADTPVTAVALPVLGELDATVLMLFSETDARVLCELFGVEPGSELGVSALCEVGNILGASYLGALGETTGLALEPGPPQSASDMLGAVVSSVLAAGSASAGHALVLDSSLVVEGTDCSLSFMLVPSTISVHELFERLGLGR
jgi:chemotaxis protein CheC